MDFVSTDQADAYAIGSPSLVLAPQAESGRYLVSASLGAGPDVPGDVRALRLQASSGEEIVAQARVLSRSRRGMARRLLLRFPCDVHENDEITFRTSFECLPPPAEEMLTEVTPYFFALKAGPRRLFLLGNYLSVLREEAMECGVQLLCPEFPVRFMGPEITVIENGPHFVWVVADYYGGAWNASLEIKADRFGECEFTSRLLRMRGDAPMPEFGFRVIASGATVSAIGQPFDGGTRNVLNLPGRVFRIQSAGGVSAFWVPEGPQVRQGRVSVTHSECELQVDVYRTETLEPEKPVRFLEGQERSVGLFLLRPDQPRGESCRRWAIPAPDSRSAAHTKSTPVDWGELSPLRAKATSFLLSLQCLDGDDFGDVAIETDIDRPQYTPTHLTRLDVGLTVLEDYYRGGDERIRDWALRWAENYVNLHLYRGWDLNAHGGERYAILHERSIPSYGQKGVSFLILAYEETGDWRYFRAARACLDRVVKHLEHACFLGSYSLDRGWTLDANVRAGYLCKDLVEFYLYTGDTQYLNAAQKILRGLSKLRLGESLWKEGYPDPYSPLDIPITGEDIGILEDTSNFEKPFILQYILQGAQKLYGATEDEPAKKIVADISDWLASTQSPVGLWNYPLAGSPAGSVSHLSLLLSRALLKSYVLLGTPDYVQAAEASLRLAVQMFERYGTLPEGHSPADKPFFYAQDYTDWDFRRLQLSIGRVHRDSLADFLGAMDLYFVVAFDPVNSLRRPLTDDLAKYLLDEAPIAENATEARFPEFASRSSTVDQELRRCLEIEKSGTREEAMAAWETFTRTYPGSPLESLRLIRLAAVAGDTEGEMSRIEAFLQEFPNHPRCGWMRLRQAELEEKAGRPEQAAALLQSIMEDFIGTVWERDAETQLFRLGKGPLPAGVVIAQSGDVAAPFTMTGEPFIDRATGRSARQRTGFGIAFDATSLSIRVQCLDRALSGEESIRVYLDPVHDYESWCSFGVTVSARRTFRNLGWVLHVPVHENESDWAAEVTPTPERWDVAMRIPLAKLKVTSPLKGRIFGLNIDRDSNRERSVWQPMLSQPVMPHAFGRLLFL